MGILNQVLSLPMAPGVYGPRDKGEVHRTIIAGNNALIGKQILQRMQKSGTGVNLLCVDTYGLEPDRKALGKSVFTGRSARHSGKCRRCERRNASCFLHLISR